MFKKYIKIFFLSLLILSSLVCSKAWAKEYVRVAIIQDTESLKLTVKGYYKIVDFKTGRTLNFGKSINTVVTVAEEGVLVGDLIYKSRKLFIDAVDPESIIINDRKFRGNVLIIRKDKDHLLVVNFIDLEDYVKGILYHEVSHYWPKEALKAQAVVSRTYALNQIEQSAARDFDVTNDIYSQVYGGKTSERYRTNKAVEETQGQVLTFNNKIFSTYFHATCAGHTEDARYLWNIDIAPLRGVVCGYCKESPHFAWHAVIPLKDIKQALIKAGFNECGDIFSIDILGKDVSGRITDLKVKTSKRDFIIPAKDFRINVSPNLIRSTNFTLNIEGSDSVFEGFGWGHGVGMCQWGAYFMAKSGHNYQGILAYYYPGSKLITVLDK